MSPTIPDEIKNYIYPYRSFYKDDAKLKLSIKKNPTIIKTYESWKIAYRNLVKSQDIFITIDSIIEDAKLKLPDDVQKTTSQIDAIANKEIFQRSYVDPDILYVEERIELIYLGLLGMPSLLHDDVVIKTLFDENKNLYLLPSFKKIETFHILLLLKNINDQFNDKFEPLFIELIDLCVKNLQESQLDVLLNHLLKIGIQNPSLHFKPKFLKTILPWLKSQSHTFNYVLFFEKNMTNSLIQGIKENIIDEQTLWDLFGIRMKIQDFHLHLITVFNEEKQKYLMDWLRTKITKEEEFEPAIDFCKYSGIDAPLQLLLHEATEEEETTICNSLSLKAIQKNLRSNNYKSDFTTFQKDLPLFRALLKKEGGQDVVVQKLTSIEVGFSLLYGDEKELKLVFSIIAMLDSSHFLDLLKKQKTPLNNYWFLIQATPLMIEKLTSEQITQALLQPNEQCDIIVNDPLKLYHLLVKREEKCPLLLSEKLLPEHLYQILFYQNPYKPNQTPIRMAILEGIIDGDFLFKISGFDFNAQAVMKAYHSLLDMEEIKIRNELFAWAVKQPPEQLIKCITFALSMGCIKQFMAYFATLNEIESQKLCKSLGPNILFLALQELDENNYTVMQENFQSTVPILRFLLSQENGKEKILDLFSIIFYRKTTSFVISNKDHIVNFLNNLLLEKDGFALVKDILLVKNVSDRFFIDSKDACALLKEIHINQEQLVEILSVTDIEYNLFGKLLFHFQDEFIINHLDVEQIIKFLSTKDINGRTPLHLFMVQSIALLKKISDSKIDGLKEIQQLFSIPDNYHNRPIVNFRVCIPFLRHLKTLTNGTQLIHSLLMQEDDREKRIIESISESILYNPSEAREQFEFINTLNLPLNYILKFLFPKKDINEKTPLETHANLLWAAIPLLERLATSEETREDILDIIIPKNPKEDCLFDRCSYTWDCISFLIRIYPKTEFIAPRLCKKNVLKNIIGNLSYHNKLNDLLPILKEFLTSEQVVNLLCDLQEKNVNICTTYFANLTSLLSEFLEPEHLAKFLLEDNANLFKECILEAKLNRHILSKLYDFDFDPTSIAQNNAQSKEKNLEDALMHWINSKPSGLKRARSLLMLYFLEYYSPFYEEYRKLTEEEQKVLQALMPAGASIKIIAQAYTINPDHMQEKVQIHVHQISPLLMDEVEFVGVPKIANRKDDKTFYSFIPDMISGAINDGVNSGKALSGTTVAGLQEMYNKIQNNTFVYGMNGSNEEEYKIFCSYLTHIVIGYKIGQVGGDNEDKEMVLNGLADQVQYCFPGWKQFIQQCYGMIHKDHHVPILNLRDRLLARLQAERKYILSVRMLMLGESDNIHEPNYLLDMFREDLGTQLELINDPHTQSEGYQRDYGKDKSRLRNEFDELYSKEFLISSVAHHVNEQQERARPSKYILDLPPLWVSDWLREQCGSSWKQEEYEKIPQKVSAMQLEGKNEEDIDAFLLSYGIERRLEDSVEEAIKELKRDIAIARKRDFIKISTSLKEKIEDIYSIADLGERSLKKKEFLELNPSILGSVNSSKEQLKKSVDAFIFSQKERIKKLEDLLESVEKENSENIQKDILRKNGRIQSAQSFEELMAPHEIKNAQIAKFFSDVVFRNQDVRGKKKRVFTFEAAALLLESMGILKR